MKFTILFSIWLFSFNFLTAQNHYDFDYAFHSKAFDKERKFYVHVHEDYYENETDSFGVVYVLDAQGTSFYNNAKSIIDYLVWSRQITPLIVVGIHSDNRGREFIPLDRNLDADHEDNRGQAHLLRKHIEDEIFPKIKSDFRVNDFKAIIGHSRGGAFIANTVFSDDHDMFNAYIAISPGMHYLNRQILDDAKSRIQSNAKFHNFYFCTYGTVGELEHYFKPQVEYLDSLFQAHPNNTIHWKKKEMLGKTHWTLVAPSVTEGILEMNRAYKVDQKLVEQYAKNEGQSIKDQIDQYRRQQKQILNYSFPQTYSRMRYYGYQLTEMGMTDRALELFEICIGMDEHNIRGYMGKAATLENMELYDEAKAVYKKALNVLTDNVSGLSSEEVQRRQKYINETITTLEEK